MKINEIIHGFTVTEKRKIFSPEGCIYILSHPTGARVVYFEREDRNKTFAIGFRTLPTDDTGVFHIIEHSTLCGSERFPTKEPFVELLKCSLNTFLNAFTCEDKTVYPVSSQNDKDFYNLVSVYLDAVFSPLMIENENIFLQEGWHYSFDEEGNASYNGVVYNEMTGAYSSPEELSSLELSRSLFEGTPYACDSGGNPESIPTLTYENFRAAHEAHYHPSNSTVVLDGRVDLDSILPLIDSYFSRYERRTPTLPVYKITPRVSEPRRVFYRSDDGDGRGRVRISIGSVFADYKNRLDNLAATVLISTLAGSNESPLKKALLDKRLCDDVYMYVNRSEMQTFVVEIVGVKEENADAAIQELHTTAEKLIKEGISASELSATLSHLEFKLIEGESGSMPKGVSHALAIIDALYYGEDIESVFEDEGKLGELSALIPTGYFERLLERILLKPTHAATVLLIPDSEVKSAPVPDLSELSEDEITALMKKEAALLISQSEPDSPEALKTIPTLEISDLDRVGEFNVPKEESYLGRRLILPAVKSESILYVSLFFDSSDLDEDSLTLLTLLSAAITNLETENYSPLLLSSKIKACHGSFATVTGSTSLIDGRAVPYIKLVGSVLAKNTDELVKITEEALLKTRYTDYGMLEKLLLQIRSVTEDSMREGGDSLALGRAEAHTTPYGKIMESLVGLDAYRRIKKYIEAHSKRPEALSEELASLAGKIFVRERITVSVASSERERASAQSLAKRLIELFPCSDNEIVPRDYKPLDSENEVIVIPTDTSYTATSLYSEEAKENYGILRIARTALSYGYLWENVRVKGGAYGTGFSARRMGAMSFHSYRDPSPENSLKIYKGAPDALRELARDTDLSRFIIGVIGDLDQPKSPRLEAAQATADALNGWTAERDAGEREKILTASKDSLLLAADIIERAQKASAEAVVTGDKTARELSARGFKVISPQKD
jgi:Zn-dependent M16 (insulinase) family peptidase